MLVMEQTLMIGPLTFHAIAEATLESSREIPTDVLTIKLPKYRNLDRDRIAKYHPVKWQAGYTKYGINTEFTGYVNEINPGLPLEIKCVDPMFFCQKQRMKNDYYNHPLNSFLKDCLHDKIKDDITIEIVDADIKKTVSIHCAGQSGRFALWQLRKSHGVDVFFHDWKLVVQKAFKRTNETEKIPVFRFDFNIIDDTLIPREAKDIIIVVRGENPKTGIPYKKSFSPNGKGEKEYFDIDGLDAGSAMKRAKELFLEKCGSGFNGDFTTFGYPSVRHSQVIEVIDKDDKTRSAQTFVNKVKKTWSTSGYRQIISPGYFYAEPVKQNTRQPENNSKFRNNYQGKK